MAQALQPGTTHRLEGYLRFFAIEEIQKPVQFSRLYPFQETSEQREDAAVEEGEEILAGFSNPFPRPPVPGVSRDPIRKHVPPS